MNPSRHPSQRPSRSGHQGRTSPETEAQRRHNQGANQMHSQAENPNDPYYNLQDYSMYSAHPSGGWSPTTTRTDPRLTSNDSRTHPSAFDDTQIYDPHTGNSYPLDTMGATHPPNAPPPPPYSRYPEAQSDFDPEYPTWAQEHSSDFYNDEGTPATGHGTNTTMYGGFAAAAAAFESEARAFNASNHSGQSSRAIRRLTRFQNAQRIFNIISRASQSLLRRLASLPVECWPVDFLDQLALTPEAVDDLFDRMERVSHAPRIRNTQGRCLLTQVFWRLDNYRKGI
ncbi:hypothetical protein TWF696_000204 [Orbilia brochopaga]|uniref:Uncharacterized protein n=1 Tax=Orbilia brochopaga TaxID=3140254 RepID=A0AAV9VB03_9PEZI